MELVERTDHGTVERFARALRLAVYDCELEQQGELRFFYDADVVFNIVLGSLQFMDHRPSWRVGPMLVRALLSMGYLGRMRVLPPHSLELAGLIRGLPSPAEWYSDRLKSFLEHAGVHAHVERLHHLVRELPSDEAKLARFLQELQDIGAHALVAMELGAGTWQQRFKRLVDHRLLSFDQPGPEADEVLWSDTVWEFKTAISRVRPDDRFALNNLRDAAALAILSTLVGRHNAGEQTCMVRFHTETRLLNAVCRETPRLRDLLSYSHPSFEGTSRVDRDMSLVIRDSDYFLVRSSFEALRFPGIVMKDVHPAVQLDQLKALASHLSDLHRTNVPEKSVMLIGQPILGRQLGDVIDEFASLSFLRSLWARYELPPAARELIPKLAEVWEFASQPIVADRLDEEIREIQHTVYTQVARVQRWQDAYLRICGAARQRSRPTEMLPAPDPMRDIGLAIWGIPWTAAQEERLVSLVHGIMGADHEDWIRACANLATLVEHVDGDEEACGVACGALLFLNEYECIVHTIMECTKERGGTIAIGYDVLREAAIMLGRRRLGIAHKQQMLTALFDGRRGLQENTDDLGRFLLGFGHVAYAAWETERGTLGGRSAFGGEQHALIREWAKWSFEAGSEAVMLLGQGSLEWAFAINHCARVGSMAGIERERTEAYLETLLDLRATGLWHYRFEDTWAWHLVVSARRRWDEEKDQRDAEALDSARRQVCAELEKAQRYLDRARPSFGDPLIEVHKMQLLRLQEEVGLWSHRSH